MDSDRGKEDSGGDPEDGLVLADGTVLACGPRPRGSWLVACRRRVEARILQHWIPAYMEHTATIAAASAPKAPRVSDAEQAARVATLQRLLFEATPADRDRFLAFLSRRRRRSSCIAKQQQQQQRQYMVTLPANDAHFWMEVQRFKRMCGSSAHGGPKLARTKAEAIISVYLQSTVPPAVQISLAEGLVEKLLSLHARFVTPSPYLFTQAERAVANALQPHVKSYTAWLGGDALERGAEDAAAAAAAALAGVYDNNNIMQKKGNRPHAGKYPGYRADSGTTTTTRSSVSDGAGESCGNGGESVNGERKISHRVIGAVKFSFS